VDVCGYGHALHLLHGLAHQIFKEDMKEVFESFFNFLNSHSNEQWERFLAWSLMTFIVYFVLFREDKELRRGLKGEDQKWQLPEAIGYGFIYLLPGILTTAFFLAWKIQPEIMYIIDIILLSALGIRGAIQGVKTWKNGHHKEQNPTPKQGE
jgi:hypothetical protein